MSLCLVLNVLAKCISVFSATHVQFLWVMIYLASDNKYYLCKTDIQSAIHSGHTASFLPLSEENAY